MKKNILFFGLSIFLVHHVCESSTKSSFIVKTVKEMGCGKVREVPFDYTQGEFTRFMKFLEKKNKGKVDAQFRPITPPETEQEKIDTFVHKNIEHLLPAIVSYKEIKCYSLYTQDFEGNALGLAAYSSFNQRRCKSCYIRHCESAKRYAKDNKYTRGPTFRDYILKGRYIIGLFFLNHKGESYHTHDNELSYGGKEWSRFCTPPLHHFPELMVDPLQMHGEDLKHNEMLDVVWSDGTTEKILGYDAEQLYSLNLDQLEFIKKLHFYQGPAELSKRGRKLFASLSLPLRTSLVHNYGNIGIKFHNS